MDISDELERILRSMEDDEQKKSQESNVAKQMALLAEGGAVPTDTSEHPYNDVFTEWNAIRYAGQDQLPPKQSVAEQVLTHLYDLFFPGLVQQGTYNVPTAQQGSYSDTPSHKDGGSIGFHQPGSLEHEMMALGGHKAIPIIMALHKATGGIIKSLELEYEAHKNDR